MARRKPVEAPEAGAVVVLPRLLADYSTSEWADYREFCRERNQWFSDHGINPGDWSKVRPILQASWLAHGIHHKIDRLDVRRELTKEIS